MEEDDAALKLPVEQQWAHTKWNARQNAYKIVAEKFKSSAPDDPCFSTWAPKLKSAGTDSNVIALEAGLKCIAAFAENAEPDQVDNLRASIIAPMAEKALAAAKPSVKSTFQTVCQDLVEGSAHPASIIEELIPTFSLKSPKAITAAVVNMRELFVNFGRVLPLKQVLPALPPLYAHNDKNVRAEAVNLSVVLAQVGGKAVVEAALASIKPVQLKELQPKLDSAEPIKPLRIPRVMQVQEADEGAGEDAMDHGADEPEELDPYDMAEEIHLKNKLPDISEAVGSVKWKERKEALESVEQKFNGVMRIAPDDFNVLVNQLARVIQKDANLMCVTSAMNISRMLASGLRSQFSYTATLLPPIVERFKEKKASVIESAVNAVEAIYNATGLDSVLPTLCTCLNHKTPQARIESSKFLVKLLSEVPTAPTSAQVKEISGPVVKNMTDTQEPVRAEAAKILAVMVKLVDKAMNPAISQLDDLRKQKVTDAAEHVTIKARKAAAASSSSSRAPAKAAAPSRGVAKPAASTQAAAPKQERLASRPPIGSRTAGIKSPEPRPRVAAAATAASSEPLTSTPQKQPRPIHQTDFTPAKQSQPLRRRLGSPDKATGAEKTQARPRSPLKSSAPRLPPQPEEKQPSRYSPHQSPLATLEFDKMRREKLLAISERDMYRDKLEEARDECDALGRKCQELREENERLKRELQRRNSANTSLDSNSSMDHLNNRMSNMSLKDDSFEKLSSRPITLGVPRALGFRIMEAEDERNRVQQEKRTENWRRAAEVTNELKKRIEEMKRTRMLNQQADH